MYALAAPAQILLSFLLMSPLLFWDAEKYLPMENTCFVVMSDYKSVMLSAFNTFGIPLSLLLIIYIRLTLFIRQRTSLQRLVHGRHVRRDLVAIRHIFITMMLLITIGLPAVVFVIIFYITKNENPLMYRVSWFSVAIFMACLTVGLIFTIPELKNMIIKKPQLNQVLPLQKR